MDACRVCGVTKNLKRCTGCLSVVYCSSGHQREHWKIHKNECCPFTIEESPIFGKQLIAMRDLKPGTIIFEERPIIQNPTFYKRNWVCLSCGLSFHGTTPRKCSTCGWPICSAACEKHVSHAENECRVFSSQKILFPPPPKVINSSFIDEKNVISTGTEEGQMHAQSMLSKCIALIRGLGLKKRDPSTYEKLMLESYMPPEKFNPKSLPTITELVKIFRKFVDLKKAGLDVDDEEIINFLVISEGNAMTSNDDDNRAPMQGTYLKSPRLSHSCAANCCRVLLSVPFTVCKIRTAVLVPKGEPLTINYFYDGFESLGRAERQKQIWKSWKFVCKCKRCLDPTELGTFCDGVTCTQCRPNGVFQRGGGDEKISEQDFIYLGYFLPLDPLNFEDEAEWTCNGCKNSIDYSQIKKCVQALAQDSKRAFNDQTRLDKVAKWLADTSGKILHPNHYLVQLTSHQLLEIEERRSVPPGFSRGDFDRTSLRLLHRLSIQDKISPGISLARGMTLVKLMALILNGINHGPHYFTIREKIDFLKSILAYHREAWLYFAYDPTVIKGGADKLGMIKSAAEALLLSLTGMY